MFFSTISVDSVGPRLIYRVFVYIFILLGFWFRKVKNRQEKLILVIKKKIDSFT